MRLLIKQVGTIISAYLFLFQVATAQDTSKAFSKWSIGADISYQYNNILNKDSRDKSKFGYGIQAQFSKQFRENWRFKIGLGYANRGYMTTFVGVDITTGLPIGNVYFNYLIKGFELDLMLYYDRLKYKKWSLSPQIGMATNLIDGYRLTSQFPNIIPLVKYPPRTLDFHTFYVGYGVALGYQINNRWNMQVEYQYKLDTRGLWDNLSEHYVNYVRQFRVNVNFRLNKNHLF